MPNQGTGTDDDCTKLYNGVKHNRWQSREKKPYLQLDFDTAYVHRLIITQPGQKGKMFKNVTLRLFPDPNASRIKEVVLPQVKRKKIEITLDGIDANRLRIEGGELKDGGIYQAIAEIELLGCLDVGSRKSTSQEAKVPSEEL